MHRCTIIIAIIIIAIIITIITIIMTIITITIVVVIITTVTIIIGDPESTHPLTDSRPPSLRGATIVRGLVCRLARACVFFRLW